MKMSRSWETYLPLVLLLLTWVSASQTLSLLSTRPLTYDLTALVEPDPFNGEDMSETRLKYTNNTWGTLIAHLPDARETHIEPFQPNDWYEWFNFPSENERNAVLSAMIGSVPMLLQTVDALTKNPAHKSFMRYFNLEDISTVLVVYQNLLAVLGFPEYADLRSCLRVSKLQIWYGDGPGRSLCTATGPYAYTWNYDDAFGVTRYYISFCLPFFHVYQKYDYVPCSKLGPSSDPKDEGVGTIWSASLTTLHEMLHWSELTIEIARLEVQDLQLVRPDTGQVTIAYRPFYSMHVKDWGGGKQPTTNADNYVFTVAECFYSFLCPQLDSWQDPPDPGRIWAP